MNLNRDRYVLGLLLVVTTLVLSPTFFNGFQRYWDDGWMLLNNSIVYDLSWQRWKDHFTSFHWGQYSPVNTLLYAFTYQVFGLKGAAFHGVCLALHLLNVSLIFAIFKVSLPRIDPRIGGQARFYAGFVALFFAIHPLQVEAVAWASASKVLLYSFFALLGILIYVRVFIIARRRWAYAGVVLCYLLAFASKEQAIVFPVLLLVFDAALDRFHRNDRHFDARPLLEKIPLLIVAGAMWYFSWQNDVGLVQLAETDPLHDRAVFGLYSLGKYVSLYVLPVNLSFFYLYPSAPGTALPAGVYAIALLTLAGLAIFFLTTPGRDRLVAFATLFFLVNIGLALHVLPMQRIAIMADRYMYLGVAGLSLVFAVIVARLFRRLPDARKAIATALAIYVGWLGFTTHERTREWKDFRAIKRDVLAQIEERKMSGRDYDARLEQYLLDTE